MFKESLMVICYGMFYQRNAYNFVPILYYFDFIKFRWAFRMYDKDNSGSIELGEMIEIIGTLYEMEGVSKVCLCVRDIINNHLCGELLDSCDTFKYYYTY